MELVCNHDFVNFETGEWLRDYDVKTFKQKYPDTPYLEEILQDSKIRESGIDLYIDIKQNGVVPILIFVLSEAITDFGWSGVNAVFCVYSVIISSYIYIDWSYNCSHTSGPHITVITSCIINIEVYSHETRLSRT